MKKSKSERIERRLFPRVKAPVSYRIPKHPSTKNQVTNISLGGARLYSDEHLPPGSQLEIEIYFPSGQLMKALAKVVWIKELPQGSVSLYDMGIEFMNLPSHGMEKLKEVLEANSE